MLGENVSMAGPSIVLFLSDQHRADVMGVMGDPRVRTPNLDAMAKEGVLFRRGYCNAPVCGPSRMSLLTGQMPHRIGVTSNRAALASHIPTIAHALGAAGYDTVLCGRMHFIGPDQSHGFSERLVGDFGPTNIAFEESDGGPFNGTTGQHRSTLEVSGPGIAPPLEYDREVLAAAVRRLQEQRGERPIFMVVGTYAPHNPYVCSPERYAYYRRELPPWTEKEARDFREEAHPALRFWLESREMSGVSEEEMNRSRAAYYGMVEEMDEMIGALWGAVDETLGKENTLCGYLSDHGDMAGEKGMFWKSNFLEGSVRVPMVWRGPGLAAGHAVEDPVSLLDLAPTLTDWAGAPSLPAAEGRSLVAALRGESLSQGAPVVSLLVDPRCGPSVMVCENEWKWIRYARWPEEQLFHLGRNPGESGSGAITTPEEKKVAGRLSQFAPSEDEWVLIVREWEHSGESGQLLRRYAREQSLGSPDKWHPVLERLESFRDGSPDNAK